MAKQTAGRNILVEFAPQFAALNDDRRPLRRSVVSGDRAAGENAVDRDD